MSAKIKVYSRWKLGIGILVVFLVGGLAGSLFTAQAGRANAEPANAVPPWLSAASPVASDQVTFASGFSAVAAKSVPSVVNIASTKIVQTPMGGQMSPFFNDPFFERFFGRDFQEMPRERREQSLGSGVIVSPDGYLLTNNHVVEGAREIQITLNDKREFEAKIIGTDSRTDLAVLKIDAEELPAIAFGDSSKVRVGDFAIAIGSPFGLNQTVTLGIVSATGRGELGIEDYEDFIQTDASINPGNSGGALVNVNGELIGINTAILSGGSGGNQGIGFAIPVNMARQVMDQILKQGKVIRGYLGALIQPVTPEIAEYFGLSESKGVLLADVDSDAPAGKSGLQRGDIVLELNGEPITDRRDFRLKIAAMQPGTKVQLKVLRDKTERTFDVVLGELPAESGSALQEEESEETALQGLSVEDLTPQIARQLDLPARVQGVVVSSVQPGTAASEAGIRRGDVIMEVNRRPINSVDEFRRATRQLGGQRVLLLIYRDGGTIYTLVEPF
jgi:serine protease Do